MNEVSKSPTIHLQKRTLTKLEQLRQHPSSYVKSKLVCYDVIINKLLNKHIKQLRKAEK